MRVLTIISKTTTNLRTKKPSFRIDPIHTKCRGSIINFSKLNRNPFRGLLLKLGVGNR
uniref:Uncharacterized protein n=1 Tax=Lepeophtheirus salmonis TaxID=72036 RepID=A0A0K2U2Y7_LEPSM